MPLKPQPDGYQTVIPYLVASDAGKTIEFIMKTFDAKERGVMRAPNGKVMHGELSIGDSVIMIADANENHAALPGYLYVYVPDTDGRYKKALNAGAVSIMAPADQYYGDRNAGVKDSCGNTWWIGTHVEDVSNEELDRRVAERIKK